MARYHKKDLVYFKKDGKPTIAVVAMVTTNYGVTSMMVLDQAGHEDHIWLGGGFKPADPVKLITDKVYDKLTQEQKDIVDNFNFDKAVRNYRDRMMKRNKTL